MSSTSYSLETTAKALVAENKGILAADETVTTLTRRFEKLQIPSTFDSRRDYREMLFTTPSSAAFISGVIMSHETIHQQGSNGVSLSEILLEQGILPGIKVDDGVKPLAGSDGEVVTEGLDGLRERLKDYHALGARFAKWRAVIRITDRLPTSRCISTNAHALGRYASICQEQEIVPIVEAEVLMEGNHTIERCDEITCKVLVAVFDALYEQKVSLEGILLKPNMIVSGSACSTPASVAKVADTTLRCLLRHAPAAIPGVAFLSGSQSAIAATEHLNEISLISEMKPWKISFSFGRALQDPALATWLGDNINKQKAQQAFHHRARCSAAATAGRYNEFMENEFVGEIAKGHRSDWEDD